MIDGLLNPMTPFPLNPNIGCVERVRNMFCTICKRRLVLLARTRPEDFAVVEDWLMDIQLNTLPIALTDINALRSIWLTIARNAATREFIYGICFELRTRAFEDQTDFDAFIDTIAVSLTQFSDQLSVLSEEDQQVTNSLQNTRELLAGNSWIIAILMVEQHTIEEMGLHVAASEYSLAKGEGNGG